jgi:hypothetical protein
MKGYFIYSIKISDRITLNYTFDCDAITNTLFLILVDDSFIRNYIELYPWKYALLFKVNSDEYKKALEIIGNKMLSIDYKVSYKFYPILDV